MERLLGEVKWDMAIINEELSYDVQRAILDTCWERMNMDGLIVMDYVSRHKPNQEAYEDFCKAKNRLPVIVNTRYGVGLIRR
jgi:predicted TIM-barrel enzyme